MAVTTARKLDRSEVEALVRTVLREKLAGRVNPPQS